jgi:hypothetical protein
MRPGARGGPWGCRDTSMHRRCVPPPQLEAVCQSGAGPAHLPLPSPPAPGGPGGDSARGVAAAVYPRRFPGHAGDLCLGAAVWVQRLGPSPRRGRAARAPCTGRRRAIGRPVSMHGLPMAFCSIRVHTGQAIRSGRVHTRALHRHVPVETTCTASCAGKGGGQMPVTRQGRRHMHPA